jgi:hypothetical protein
MRTTVEVLSVAFLFSLSQFVAASPVTKFLESRTVRAVGLAIFVVAYLMYLLAFFHLSSKAINHLKTHMVMIEARGIDPLTTPTCRKIRMLRRVRTYGSLVFLLHVISTVLFFSGMVVYWVLYMLVEMLVAVLYALMCYECRIRSNMHAVYGEDEEAYVVTDNQTLTPWNPSVVLPSMPRKVKKTHKIHSGVAGLDTPDPKPPQHGTPQQGTPQQGDDEHEEPEERGPTPPL